jgi:dienelactone hydrolase
VIVDSHGPRGLDQLEFWRLVCAGQLLNGAERAADVAIALSVIHDRPELDADRVALIGLSHGGWTVLDFLSLARQDTPPPLLTRWPAAIAGDPAGGIRKAVLFYPYCGTAARASAAPIAQGVDYLFLLAENDTITPRPACEALAERLRASGADTRVEVFAGATHGFDQQERSILSNLVFDPEARDRATAMLLAFLDGA